MKKNIFYSVTLVASMSLLGLQLRNDYVTINKSREIIGRINNMNYNLSNLYDNIVKQNELLNQEGIEESVVNINKTSLLQEDFNRCQFDVLSVWNETFNEGTLYYDNVPETTLSETEASIYYLESGGEVVESSSETSEAESVSASLETVVETFANGETAVSVVENTSEALESTEVVIPEVKNKTYIIMSVSKYYNSDTVQNIVYEFYNGKELLGNTGTDGGLVIKNLKLDNGYSNSRIDLVELDGSYDIASLSYKIKVSNNVNSVESVIKPLEITSNIKNEDYIIHNVDNEPIVFIMRDSVAGSNRIEILEKYRESIVDTSTEQESLLESSASSEVETTTETSSTVDVETSSLSPAEEQKLKIQESPSVVESATAITEAVPKKVLVKDTDEMYTLTYNFECWGSSDAIKKLNNSSIEIVNKLNGEAFTDTENMQIKFNDAKYKIDEANKFIELDFSVNIQVLRSKLQNYLDTINSDYRLSSSTINTFKNGFDTLFKLRLTKEFEDGTGNIAIDLNSK